MSDRVAATSFATSHYWLKLGLALVLSLRLLYVFYIPDAIVHWRDGLSYDNIARNLISGVGYWDTTGEWPGEPPFADPSAPTVRWIPGYPLFIAGVYLIFGESYRTVYVAQAVLGVAIAGLIYLLAKDTLGKHVGVLAVFLYAVDPFSITICGRFQTEQLFEGCA
jgi:4-amino-4-deoxy-L-arabinose transferase-like glycosyltransferase